MGLSPEEALEEVLTRLAVGLSYGRRDDLADCAQALLDDLKADLGQALLSRKVPDDAGRMSGPFADDPTKAHCNKCGRRDGLDAAVSNEVWTKISGRADSGGLLCLWCMDELAAQQGLEDIPARLYFSGKALVSVPVDEFSDLGWSDEVGEEALTQGKADATHCPVCGSAGSNVGDGATQHFERTVLEVLARGWAWQTAADVWGFAAEHCWAPDGIPVLIVRAEGGPG